MTKYVYFFGSGKAEGSSLMRNLLGGKGCELAEMTNLGIPVPPGFTITTEAWAEYNRRDRHLPDGLWEEVLANLAKLQAAAGLSFGDPTRPLLVSVRSGARVSMPGMMETILNLGLNDATVEGLASWTGNERFAWDCYRRFITMFGDVVLHLKRDAFEEHLQAVKKRLGLETDPDIPAPELRKLVQTYKELLQIADRLERHYKDMQDIEFTVQEGRLYLLQTRAGKRSAEAAVRVAVDLVHEHVIDRDTALLRVWPADLNKVLHPRFDEKDKARAIGQSRLLARGLPAAPGAAVGQVVFDADLAVERARAAHKVILVRPETSPEDIAGMYAAEGILTARGGRTSHAAVVAVGMGKPCVVGASEVVVHEDRGLFEASGVMVREGDLISVDGSTGEVLRDPIETIQPELSGAFKEFLTWADARRSLGVRANADTPHDAAKAREFGAEGIGLVRTEHMFFAPDRIAIVREMIMATDQASRRAAVGKLLPSQREDFIGMLRALDGLPVTIRLLDPPLHEFLPNWK